VGTAKQGLGHIAPDTLRFVKLNPVFDTSTVILIQKRESCRVRLFVRTLAWVILWQVYMLRLVQ